MDGGIGAKQATVEVKDDGIIILHYLDDLEVSKEINLNEFFKAVKGEINVIVKPYKFRKPTERKPIFTYICDCNVEVKTKKEDLDVVCEQCNTKLHIKG